MPQAAMVSAYVCLGRIIQAAIASAFRNFKKKWPQTNKLQGKGVFTLPFSFYPVFRDDQQNSCKRGL